MRVAAAILVLVALLVGAPLVAAVLTGYLVAPGDGYRTAPALGGICCLVIVSVALVVVFVLTPANACGGTGCDTNYGLGGVFGGCLMFLPSLGGIVLGRWFRRKRVAQVA